MTSEVGLGGHKSCIRSANISCGSVVGDYPTPNRQGVDVLARVNRSILHGQMNVDTHFIHHINKGLGLGSREASGHL